MIVLLMVMMMLVMMTMMAITVTMLMMIMMTVMTFTVITIMTMKLLFPLDGQSSQSLPDPSREYGECTHLKLSWLCRANRRDVIPCGEF